MKTQYSHELVTSFFLWLDHTLLDKAEAFENKTGAFFPYDDKRLVGHSMYGSSHAQFVYDSSITGVSMISGVFDPSQTFIGRGTSGLKIDYKYGRAIFDNGNDGLSISGAYAVKDFNVYTSPREEEFIFEEAFGLTEEKVERSFSYVDPYKIVAPCAVIKFDNNERNEPFAFGGEDWTKTTIKVILITQDYYKLQGAISALRDRNSTCFSNIDNWADLPFNYYGDLKSGVFNYNELAAKYSSNKVHVEKVYASRIMEGRALQNDTFYASYLEFDLGKARFPRA